MLEVPSCPLSVMHYCGMIVPLNILHNVLTFHLCLHFFRRVQFISFKTRSVNILPTTVSHHVLKGWGIVFFSVIWPKTYIMIFMFFAMTVLNHGIHGTKMNGDTFFSLSRCEEESILQMCLLASYKNKNEVRAYMCLGGVVCPIM